MIRVVERPLSTSHYLEWPFHWCKTVQEIKNLTDGVNPNNIVIIMRSINPNSFQPIGYFVINDPKKSWHYRTKFGATFELMQDAGLEEVYKLKEYNNGPAN